MFIDKYHSATCCNKFIENALYIQSFGGINYVETNGKQNLLLDTIKVIALAIIFPITLIAVAIRSLNRRGTQVSKVAKSDPPSSLQPTNLDTLNVDLKKIIEQTPKYKLLTTTPYFNTTTYHGGPIPKEILDIHTHQHQIFEDVYLGDLRGYLSVDPNFVSSHSMLNSGAKIILTASAYQEHQALLNQPLDDKGCSELGIKYVLSAIQYTPKEPGNKHNWSSFIPELEQLKITRLEIAVDDDYSKWDTIKPHLDKAFEFIDKARREKKPILIHCVKGASRSVTILTAYLMSRCNVTRLQAFNFIQTNRTQAELKPAMLTGLDAYQDELKTQYL